MKTTPEKLAELKRKAETLVFFTNPQMVLDLIADLEEAQAKLAAAEKDAARKTDLCAAIGLETFSEGFFLAASLSGKPKPSEAELLSMCKKSVSKAIDAAIAAQGETK